ncbi:Voltage-gated Ion Channel (VIC) Superfamily [Candida maltosa Xu316]|uniref:Voltage-gated Ion Channel (VIC) Superfamily n=1 Tax=Candida maltosa (strain Xu316) TaxID=1245528 RepID=M3J7E0_CANMX|nr:Voltage-gated Ion Channel (VIC) Superfamily [Candida maltosa Xu316]
MTMDHASQTNIMVSSNCTDLISSIKQEPRENTYKMSLPGVIDNEFQIPKSNYEMSLETINQQCQSNVQKPLSKTQKRRERKRRAKARKELERKLVHENQMNQVGPLKSILKTNTNRSHEPGVRKRVRFENMAYL